MSVARLVRRFVEALAPGQRTEALLGDLIEESHKRRSAIWLAHQCGGVLLFALTASASRRSGLVVRLLTCTMGTLLATCAVQWRWTSFLQVWLVVYISGGLAALLSTIDDLRHFGPEAALRLSDRESQ